MTQSVTLINTSTDTFQTLVNKLNEVANLASNTMVTANTNANGSITTGNAYGNGIFAYATVGVVTALRGGNVQSSAELPVTSNVYVQSSHVKVGNSTANATANSTQLTFSTGAVYGQSIYQIGNSTVNVVANTTQLKFNGKSSYTGTSWYVGTTTVNAVANSTAIVLANSTVSFTLSKPTAAQAADGNYFQRADGAWSNVADLVLKVYDSSNTLLFP